MVEQLQSAARVVQTLEYVASHRNARLTDVANALGLHRSNALRLLTTLRNLGWISVDESGLLYRLGPSAMRLSHTAMASTDLGDLVKLATVFRDLSGETALIAVPHGDGMLVVERVDSEDMLRVSSNLFSIDPLWCTGLGKAYLATLANEEVTSIISRLEPIKFTSNTLTTIEGVLADLAVTRSRGYAIDNEEARPGIRCFAVAVSRSYASAVSAVSIIGPSDRWTWDRIAQLAPRLLDAVSVQGFNLAGDKSQS